MSFELEKRPRQYAQEIIALGPEATKEQRRAALADCPEHLQEAIKSHVKKWWDFQVKGVK